MSLEIAEAVAAMIAEREQIRTAEYDARAARVAADREDHQTRRRYGLRRRYALKATRIQQQPSIT